MGSAPQPTPTLATATVEMAVGDWRLQARLPVPTGPTPLRMMLPVLQNLTDGVMELAVKATEEKGKPISCKKGCGACCRQLVPITEVEARHIAALVEALPEPRRSQVRARFADARRRLEAAGMLEHLQNREAWTDALFRRIGLEYFHLGIPCPFLEDESCSIHPDRPLTCREYLVTSPAENCSHPTADNLDWVRLPFRLWTSLARFTPAPEGSLFLRWVPLVLAPEWAAEHPDDLPPRPGPEWLGEFLERLSIPKKDAGQAEAAPAHPWAAVAADPV